MKNILFIGLLLFTLSACSDFLKEYSQYLSKVETISDLDELLLGSAYLPASKYNYNVLVSTDDPYNLFIHLMSDEVEQNGKTNSGVMIHSAETMFGYYTWQRQVGYDSEGTSTRAEDGCWNQTYKYINAVNIILDELNNVSTKTPQEETDKIRVEGEAYFLRAAYYFTLVNLYAEPYAPLTAATTPGVPLKLTSYIEDKTYVRNSVSEIYAQILKDLEKAKECLAQTEKVSIYQADLTATYFLMSRVYLYMQDYKNARSYAQQVLDRNNALANLTTFQGEGNFLTSESPEVIFSMGGHLLSPMLLGSPYDYYGNLQSDSRPFYISKDLYETFDDNDLRKRHYITQEDGKYIFSKVSWGRDHWNEACSVSDNFLFRTSEAYLNLAEAAAFDNDEGTARQMIGLLQAKRYSTPPTIAESGNALIDLIREERQRELCLEGHRWYDLRRYTVCEKYPWSKTYRHTYTKFTTISYQTVPGETRIYELGLNDKAYTLTLPREVLDFQVNLGSNNRPEREPVEIIENNNN